ncbi:MAG: UDP binding domain-containing protein [Synechococcus sp.]
MWGLAFKPNTDDMREAPSRELLEALWADGATVAAYDPKAAEEAERLYPEALAEGRLTLAATKEEATEGADALLICTEWKRFIAPNFDQLGCALRQKLIFDGRNLYDPERLAEMGWTYYGIGRGGFCAPGGLRGAVGLVPAGSGWGRKGHAPPQAADRKARETTDDPRGSTDVL